MYVSVCLWAMKSMHFPFYIHTTCLTSQSDVMEQRRRNKPKVILQDLPTCPIYCAVIDSEHRTQFIAYTDQNLIMRINDFDLT